MTTKFWKLYEWNGEVGCEYADEEMRDQADWILKHGGSNLYAGANL